MGTDAVERDPGDVINDPYRGHICIMNQDQGRCTCADHAAALRERDHLRLAARAILAHLARNDNDGNFVMLAPGQDMDAPIKLQQRLSGVLLDALGEPNPS